MSATQQSLPNVPATPLGCESSQLLAQSATAHCSPNAPGSVVVTAVIEVVDTIGVHACWGQGERGTLLWQNIWGSQNAKPKVGDSISLVVELASRSREQRLLLAFPDRAGQWAPEDQ